MPLAANWVILLPMFPGPPAGHTDSPHPLAVNPVSLPFRLLVFSRPVSGFEDHPGQSLPRFMTSKKLGQLMHACLVQNRAGVAVGSVANRRTYWTRVGGCSLARRSELKVDRQVSQLGEGLGNRLEFLPGPTIAPLFFSTAEGIVSRFSRGPRDPSRWSTWSGTGGTGTWFLSSPRRSRDSSCSP